MDKYLEAASHFSNLSYYTNTWISDNINHDTKLNYNETDSINFLKKNNLSPKINNKFDLGLPNVLHCKWNKNLFIAFPGIRNNTDKKNCLDFSLIFNEKLKCSIHRGFDKIFSKLEDELALIIDTNKDDFDNIIFIGHSLGAAIAKVSALSFKLSKNYNISCITYASPLIGDSTFAQIWNSEIKNKFTLCCEKDFLIRIPSWRVCDEDDKFMINSENNIEVYKNKTSTYLFNLITLNSDSHRLYYYMNFLRDKNYKI